MKNKELWDLAVIGGGPAGMMAAGRAAEKGAKVILIEKNNSLGKKLRITGGGRCNVTNAEYDNRKLLSKYKDAEQFLFSAFSEWGVKDTFDFFEKRDMPIKIEALQRAFPASDSAESVWNVLVEYLKENNVEVLSDSEVVSIKSEKNLITKIVLKSGKEIYAKNFVLATGGKSREETGSTGDGFIWLKDLGHKVIEPNASLVPVAIKDKWVKKLSGVSLQKVKISVIQNNIKHKVSKGKILFTHFGISGPTILNLSREIGELLEYDGVVISLDILPELDNGMLNNKLQEIFKVECNKKIKNSLDSLMPTSVVNEALEISKVDPEKKCNSITRDERIKLVDTIKNMKMKVDGLLGSDKAIITSGGVDLKEVNFKTMQSRLFPNLYLIGDILNIDRPSGGYSLQLCWTTGFVAGNSIRKTLDQ